MVHGNVSQAVSTHKLLKLRILNRILIFSLNQPLSRPLWWVEMQKLRLNCLSIDQYSWNKWFLMVRSPWGTLFDVHSQWNSCMLISDWEMLEMELDPRFMDRNRVMEASQPILGVKQCLRNTLESISRPGSKKLLLTACARVCQSNNLHWTRR